MALAMFVGCDNAPVIPSFVVGGNVVSGDFLVGQTFDPGKFSITVNYDNGKRVTDDATAKVVFGGDESGKVAIGDTATVFYGNDYLGEPVTEKVALNVYTIKSLAVTAPEVNGEEASKLRPEDITVVATYLDSDNAEKTMTLTSTEYTIDTEINYVGNEPSSAEPQVQAYYNVIPQVGVPADAAKPYGKLYFTAEFEPSKVYTADDVLEIVNVLPKESLKLYAFDYDYIPRPAFEDVEIRVKYKGVEYPYNAGTETAENWVTYDVLTENIEGLDLAYVYDGLPLNTGKLATEGIDKLKVRATIGDLRYESSNEKNLKTVSVEIKAVEGFVGEKVYGDTALPEINAEDFVVTYTDSNIKDYVPAEDLELVYGYYGTEDKVVEVLPGEKVISNITLSVFAKYNGVRSATGVEYGTTIDVPTPTPVLQSISVELATGFVAPAKMVSYTDVGTAVTAPEKDDVVVTATYDIGEPKPVTATSVAYSTSATTIVAPTATSFNGETPVYLYVTYTEGKDTKTASINIAGELSEAYANSLAVSFDYSMVTADTADETAIADKIPMAGAEIVDFQVVAKNSNGVVAVLDEDEYQFMLDGVFTTEIDPSTYVVGKEASKTYDVTALLVTDDKGTRDYVTLEDAFTFKAGTGWIDFESVANALEFKLASEYDNRVGAEISKDATDYEIVATSYASAVNAGTGDAPVITIKSVEIVDDGATGKKIEATGNSVIFTVSYTDVTGAVKEEQIAEPWTFDGVSGVELSGDDIKVLYDGSAFDGTVDPYTTYTVAKFTLDESSYTVYGEAKPVLQVLKNGSAVSDETIEPGWHTAAGYSVKVTYTALSKNAETGLYEAAAEETVVEIPLNGNNA